MPNGVGRGDYGDANQQEEIKRRYADGKGTQGAGAQAYRQKEPPITPDYVDSHPAGQGHDTGGHLTGRQQAAHTHRAQAERSLDLRKHYDEALYHPVEHYMTGGEPGHDGAASQREMGPVSGRGGLSFLHDGHYWGSSNWRRFYHLPT